MLILIGLFLCHVSLAFWLFTLGLFEGEVGGAQGKTGYSEKVRTGPGLLRRIPSPRLHLEPFNSTSKNTFLAPVIFQGMF